MDVIKINKLEDLLEDFLDRQQTIVATKISRLNAAGDNLAGLLLAVKIVTKHKNSDKEEIVEAVAKMPPPTEFLQKMLRTDITFKIETDFYRKIVPTLTHFLENRNRALSQEFFDLFPKFYASRFNLSGGNTVDNDCVLLLENLTSSGFELIERTIGFDFDNAIFFLQKFALFHAVPIAMKILAPDDFENEIKSTFISYHPFDISDDGVKNLIEKLTSYVNGDAKIKNAIESSYKFLGVGRNNPKTINKEEFATIAHGDAWTNNFLFQFHQNGHAKRVKLIDFQLHEYGSFVRDFLFFVLTSVQTEVIEKHFDDLLREYYKSFSSVLKSLGCSLEKYSFESVLDELNSFAAPVELFHVFVVLEGVFATQNEVKEIEALKSEDDFVFSVASKSVSSLCKERAAFIAKMYEKRDWIKYDF